MAIDVTMIHALKKIFMSKDLHFMNMLMTNGIIKIEVGDFLIQPIGATIEPII